MYIECFFYAGINFRLQFLMYQKSVIDFVEVVAGKDIRQVSMAE